MLRRWKIAATVTLVFVLLVVLVLSLQPPDGRDSINMADVAESQVSDSNSTINDKSISAETTPVTVEDRKEPRNLAPRAEQIAWNEERGYLDILTMGYWNYPESTLEALAENRDPIAMSMLGRRLTLKNPAKGIGFLRDAAVLGYTTTFIDISDTYRLMAKGDLDRSIGPRDSDEYYYSEAAAWLLVAQARGEHNGQYRLASLLKEMPDEIEAEVLDEACTAAPGYYQDLAEDRKQLGLSEFDNTPYPMQRQPFLPGTLCSSWPFPKPACESFEISRYRFYRCE